MRQILALCTGIIVLMTMAGCGYNKIQGLDEEVKSAWAEVLNQYQRRFDLIPNLVNTVKGYASHEKETLQAVMVEVVLILRQITQTDKTGSCTSLARTGLSPTAAQPVTAVR